MTPVSLFTWFTLSSSRYMEMSRASNGTIWTASSMTM